VSSRRTPTPARRRPPRARPGRGSPRPAGSCGSPAASGWLGSIVNTRRTGRRRSAGTAAGRPRAAGEDCLLAVQWLDHPAVRLPMPCWYPYSAISRRTPPLAVRRSRRVHQTAGPGRVYPRGEYVPLRSTTRPGAPRRRPALPAVRPATPGCGAGCRGTTAVSVRHRVQQTAAPGRIARDGLMTQCRAARSRNRQSRAGAGPRRIADAAGCRRRTS
jgi:hypothetical protein